MRAIEKATANGDTQNDEPIVEFFDRVRGPWAADRRPPYLSPGVPTPKPKPQPSPRRSRLAWFPRLTRTERALGIFIGMLALSAFAMIRHLIGF